ncbi:retrotransposon protein, putative, ty1-copia subclass, partial [Tanacetum coccineum]
MQLTLVTYLLPHLFTRWSDLWILLSIEDKLNYLEHPILAALVPTQPGQQVAPEALAAHAAWELKTLFAQQGSRSFFILCENSILASRKKGKVLKGNNKNKKPQSQLAVRGQNQRNGKNKLAYAPKPMIPPLPKREHPAKDSICHECGKIGHWKRNCPQYLAELLKKKKKTALGASGLGSKGKFLGITWFILVLSQGMHCCIGHISKKSIEKLQHDGLLNSTDLRAFEKCVPCMSGKMARKPYTHQVERAKDLLRLIHTDVCGQFKIMSRQGINYFVTFTNDISRYGYVYLLKHKHEVFETFKVFQKEVENQLGKTIKSLCSDHGGEYMSQEFLDHLKDHGIIAYRTPPYTPQHNVLWDYAHETAARILNMVPTKKVKKTPYENSLITQEASGSLENLKIIQEEDTHPFIDTSLNHEEDDLEID